MNRIASVALLGLLCVAVQARAQTEAPPAKAPAVGSFGALLKPLRDSPTPDPKLIAAVEAALGPGPEGQVARSEVPRLMEGTTTDALTLLNLFPAASALPDAAVTRGLIIAAARQAEIEVSDPARVPIVLAAIARVQPAMNKFAWRAGDCLKPYGALLAVYVDNCPADNPQLAAKLADIQIRQITAARFRMTPEKSLERLNAIDPAKLSRAKDRDQLQFLQLEQLEHVAGHEAEVQALARSIWDKPGHGFRQYAWRPLFFMLKRSGKTAEASTLLDEVVKAFPNDEAEVETMRKLIKEPPATRPTAP